MIPDKSHPTAQTTSMTYHPKCPSCGVALHSDGKTCPSCGKVYIYYLLSRIAVRKKSTREILIVAATQTCPAPSS